MNEIANNAGTSAFIDADPAAMERRLSHSMYVAVAVAVAVSAPLAPWRVTTGLLLGGVLSIFNHHWLKTSLATVFLAAGALGKRPRIGAARYVLRYFIIAGVVAAAYTLNIVSLVATLAGLCSFAVAALAEAFMQIYFVIVNREETR
ncbi:MAG TPA: ATP synthase subunit I [Pyrinomonadaceae bacterium]|jgi:hypothetical protein